MVGAKKEEAKTRKGRRQNGKFLQPVSVLLPTLEEIRNEDVRVRLDIAHYFEEFESLKLPLSNPVFIEPKP
ncbi:hypothetical protein L596_023412 [Steinernema carpocapsae]|uniref:Uncharacterized protein n=1 Tax=Steinernema carpocapsae TaxID=34508 RepID=A0A4U5MDJ9_STECR|nr:hypothetical protein L596_023412 [Steinernema carpocapsae]